MGSKYTSVSVSGYNSSPPADDGSTSASNQLTWAKHKTKLGDPLKTAVEAINSNLSTFADFGSRVVTTSDNTVASDHMKTVEIAPTVTVAVTISLGDAATMAAGYVVSVKNSSAITQTVGRVTSGDTIDGAAANAALGPGASLTYKVNSSADGYLTIGQSGSFVDTNPVVVGGTDGTKKLRFEVDGLTASTTRVATMPDKDGTMAMTSDVPSAASQAEQETGSSTSVFVSPGRQHFHPSAAKGWAAFGVTGNILASYNVTSITDSGTGAAVVNWDTDFSSGDYCAQVTVFDSSPKIAFVTAMNAGSTTFANTNPDSPFANSDPAEWYVAAFGDHA